MNIEIKGTHGYTPSETTKDYVDKKLERLTYLKDSIEDLHLTIDKSSRGVYKSMANLHFHWGSHGCIKVSDRNVFKALDKLFDKVIKKIKKEKGKVREH